MADELEFVCEKCVHYEVCDRSSRMIWARLSKEKVCTDFMEVVRCKDCRFSAQHDPYDPMECVKWATKWGVVYTTPDGYCHNGEQRTDE